MKVPTANIVVAFNRETMDRLFSQGATYTSLMKLLTDDGQDDAVMFNAESNPNFISFEHDFGFSPGMKMKLTFIDPKGEFERRYLSTSLISNVAGTNYKTKDPQVSVFSDKNNTEMKVGASDYSKEFYADLQKEYTSQFGTKEIYIAYGTGENLDLWSGPHRTVLQAADISVKGARKISLTLVPTNRSLSLNQRRGAYNEKVNLNLAGLTMRYTGESKPILFSGQKYIYEDDSYEKTTPYDPLKYLDLHENAETTVNTSRGEIQTAFDDLGLEELASTLGEFDVHSIIVDALRSYIQKATGNPNVVVLLPNINLICRKYLNETAVNARADWDTGVMNAVMGSFFKMKVDGIFLESKEVQETAKKYKFIQNFLENFGLEVFSKSKFDWRSASNVIDQGGLAQYTSVEKHPDAKARFQAVFDEKDYYGIIERASNKGIPNHMAVVQGVISKISESSQGEYPIQLGLFNETYTPLLDFWSSREGATKGCTHYPLFGGYHKFDADQEAIIVGDLALIRQYLYASIDMTKHTAEEGRLRDLAVAAKSRRQEQENTLVEPTVNPYSYQQSTGMTGQSTLAQYNELEAEGKELKAIEDAAITSQLKHIPLHPLDRAILTNSQYNRDVRKIIKPEALESLVGAFGDTSYVPDEFGYDEFTEEQLKFLKEEEIPTFRYNTTNPNVLDINFKFAPTYFAALQMGFQKMVNRRASNVANGVLPLGNGSFPIRTRGDAAAFLVANNYSQGMPIEEQQELIDDLSRRMSPDLADSMQSDELEGSDAIAALLDEAENHDLQGYVEIQQMMPGNPNSTLTSFAEKMYRESLDMNITTLPTFHLSKTMGTISSPCILFAQDATIRQTEDPRRTPLNSFFSGLYKIMGYKHTIDSKGARSEFKLTKNAVRYKDAQPVEDEEMEFVTTAG